MKPEHAERAIRTLQHIAHGRLDCGRPLGGETAREMARKSLLDLGVGWSKREMGVAEEGR